MNELLRFPSTYGVSEPGPKDIGELSDCNKFSFGLFVIYNMESFQLQ